MRQGPHHGAQKSTSTGTGDFSTSSSHVSSFTTPAPGRRGKTVCAYVVGGPGPPGPPTTGHGHAHRGVGKGHGILEDAPTLRSHGLAGEHAKAGPGARGMHGLTESGGVVDPGGGLEPGAGPGVGCLQGPGGRHGCSGQGHRVADVGSEGGAPVSGWGVESRQGTRTPISWRGRAGQIMCSFWREPSRVMQAQTPLHASPNPEPHSEVLEYLYTSVPYIPQALSCIRAWLQSDTRWCRPCPIYSPRDAGSPLKGQLQRCARSAELRGTSRYPRTGFRCQSRWRYPERGGGSPAAPWLLVGGVCGLHSP